jgi:hypothetical protein
VSPTYAADTKVPTTRSREEIERTLIRYGATAFSYGWDEGVAVVMFRANERHIRFDLPMPDRSEFARTPETRAWRSSDGVEKAYEQAVRQRWRALALVVKAKLEAVEAGIVTFEEEFLAHIVLPDGQTAGDWLIPQVADAYESGAMPSLLPPPRPALTTGDGAPRT